MSVENVYRWARVQPSRPALIYNDYVIYYAWFARAIGHTRAFLHRQELTSGTVAAVLVSPLADAWMFTLALQELGLTTVHVRSLAEVKELKLKNLSCIVTTAVEAATHHIRENVPPGVKAIAIPKLDLALTRSGDLPSPSANTRGPGGHILYTTGTTGTFKKVLWDGQLEQARSWARCRIYGFTKETVAHNLSFGLWTGTGYKTASSVWHVGGCVVLDQRPEPFRRFFQHKVTFAKMTTAMFRQFAAESSEWSKSQIWIGGAATSARLVEKVLGQSTVALYANYTSTELATFALSAQMKNSNDALWLQPAADRTVEIVDETGRECPPDRAGEIRILTTKLDSQCYLDDPESTAKVFRDGFFHPGDRAVKRADGRIRILGRVGDVLNVQGEKIPVGPIEQQIQDHLQVNEVCVFSGLNDEGEDELVIAIEADKEPSHDELDAIRQQFKTFDKVRVSVLKEFPRTEPGGRQKVRRTMLRSMLFSHGENKSSDI